MTRLDLYLKHTGLIKQRSAARRACDAGRVYVDGRPAKASRALAIGETIAVETPTQYWQVEVTDLPQRTVPKKERSRYFRLLDRQDRVGQNDIDDDLSF